MHPRDTHLVDGNNLLYRSAYAVAAQSEQRGEPIFDHRTVSFFLKSIRSILHKLNGRQCCVVWDGGHSKRRTELFPDYKGERSRDHRIQLLKMVRRLNPVLAKLKCRVFCLPGREADDVIAVLVREVEGGTIISTDKDMLQLVMKGAAVYLHAKSEFVSGEFFQERIGIDPNHYLLARAMSGDPSDSIPGITGIGMKTAATVIEKAEAHCDTPVRTVMDLLRAVNRIPVLKRGTRIKWLLESADMVRRNVELMDLSAELFTHQEIDRIQELLGSRRTFDPSVCDDLEEMGVFNLVGQFDTWVVPFRKLM